MSAPHPATSPPLPDFFISYSSTDLKWAQWIADQLKQAGFTTFYQARDFGTANFIHQMHEGGAARHIIVLLSPTYLTSDYCTAEWSSVLNDDPLNRRGRLIPLRVVECSPSGLLGALPYKDLFSRDEVTARAILLDAVGATSASPTALASFPGNASLALAASVSSSPSPFPGALPPIWNAPNRNPTFTGRDTLLIDMDNALASHQCVILTGMGGVGKTQVATEYAHRHAAEYSLVWWLRAEEITTLASDYARLATPLRLPERENPDQSVVIAAVRQALSQRSDWLLAFDNAIDRDIIRPYLPSSASGHVLVTSTNAIAWRRLGGPLPVNEFSPEEAITLLLTRTGRTKDAGAADLAHELGYLPLALEQAGAYMEETGVSCSTYLKLFLERRPDLWSRERRPGDYHHTVATTWLVAHQRLAQESPGGAALLNLCAYLAPDDIPRDLLTPEAAEYLLEALAATVADPLAVNDAIAVLRRYSLIEATDTALSVHRLVQTVTRDQLSAEEQHAWAEAAICLVDAAFPLKSSDVQTWPDCAALLPHGLAAAIHAEELDVATEATGHLLNQMGAYLHARGDLAAARAALERALAVDEAAYSPTHPAIAIRLNNLALVLQDQGDPNGARPLLERALAIDMEAYGPFLTTVADRLSNLGCVQLDQKDLPGARLRLEISLQITELVHGPDHPRVANRLNNLGAVLKRQDDLLGARLRFERALAIDEAVYGSEHIEVVTDLQNLADVQHAQCDLPGARANFQRALAIAEPILGPEHPIVAHVLNNLALVLIDQHDPEGARPLLVRALAIFQAHFGEHHPKTIKVRTTFESLDP